MAKRSLAPAHFLNHRCPRETCCPQMLHSQQARACMRALLVLYLSRSPPRRPLAFRRCFSLEPSRVLSVGSATLVDARGLCRLIPAMHDRDCSQASRSRHENDSPRVVLRAPSQSRSACRCSGQICQKRVRHFPGTPPSELIPLLEKQLVSPVLWSASMQAMLRDGIQEPLLVDKRLAKGSYKVDMRPLNPWKDSARETSAISCFVCPVEAVVSLEGVLTSGLLWPIVSSTFFDHGAFRCLSGCVPMVALSSPFSHCESGRCLAGWTCTTDSDFLVSIVVASCTCGAACLMGKCGGDRSCHCM